MSAADLLEQQLNLKAKISTLASLRVKNAKKHGWTPSAPTHNYDTEAAQIFFYWTKYPEHVEGAAADIELVRLDSEVRDKLNELTILLQAAQAQERGERVVFSLLDDEDVTVLVYSTYEKAVTAAENHESSLTVRVTKVD